MGFTLRELADHVGGEVRGDSDCLIEGVATLQSARLGQISFLANPRYRKVLAQTKASAVIVAEADAGLCPVNALLCSNPYAAFARVAALLNPVPAVETGIHPTAWAHPQSRIDPSATVGPHAVVEAGVEIGRDVVIGPGCVVGRGSSLGEGTRLMANVTLYHGVRLGRRVVIHSGAVIGGDGFGFANDRGVWIKVPQLGGVVIGDDVEIGANTTIDRGALDDTVIENGVKLDNQIQIGHNVQIGAHTIMAGCCGVSGSTRIGKGCALGGGVGLAGHLEICDNVQVTGMTLVSKSLTEPGVYSSGMPALANATWNKTVARLRHLDELAERVKELEERLEKNDE